MRFCFLSNLSMVFPMYIAYTHNMGFTAGGLLFCMLSSMFYHLDEKNDYGLLLDIFSVIVLVSIVFHSALQSSFLLTPVNILSIVLCFAALYCYAAAGSDPDTCVYNDYHAAWHVLAAYSIAAYIYSHGHTKHRVKNPSRLSKPILVRDTDDHWKGELELVTREAFMFLSKARDVVLHASRQHCPKTSRERVAVGPRIVSCVSA